MVEVKLCVLFIHVLVSLPNTVLQAALLYRCKRLLAYLLTEIMLSLRNVLLALCFNAMLFWAQMGATVVDGPWQSPNCTVENMKIRKEWYARYTYLRCSGVHIL